MSLVFDKEQKEEQRAGEQGVFATEPWRFGGRLAALVAVATPTGTG